MEAFNAVVPVIAVRAVVIIPFLKSRSSRSAVIFGRLMNYLIRDGVSGSLSDESFLSIGPSTIADGRSLRGKMYALFGHIRNDSFDGSLSVCLPVCVCVDVCCSLLVCMSFCLCVCLHPVRRSVFKPASCLPVCLCVHLGAARCRSCLYVCIIVRLSLCL